MRERGGEKSNIIGIQTRERERVKLYSNSNPTARDREAAERARGEERRVMESDRRRWRVGWEEVPGDGERGGTRGGGEEGG